MMQVVYTVCSLTAPTQCETRVLVFTPRLPIACIFAAGPELETALSEDERITTWSCADPPLRIVEEDATPPP